MYSRGSEPFGNRTPSNTLIPFTKQVLADPLVPVIRFTVSVMNGTGSGLSGPQLTNWTSSSLSIACFLRRLAYAVDLLRSSFQVSHALEADHVFAGPLARLHLIEAVEHRAGVQLALSLLKVAEMLQMRKQHLLHIALL